MGSPALDALEYALKSRTLHVRSAALRAIATVDEARAKHLATPLLKDRAHEVRQVAEQILKD